MNENITERKRQLGNDERFRKIGHEKIQLREDRLLT